MERHHMASLKILMCQLKKVFFFFFLLLFVCVLIWSFLKREIHWSCGIKKDKKWGHGNKMSFKKLKEQVEFTTEFFSHLFWFTFELNILFLFCSNLGCTHTLMGRSRILPLINGPDKAMRNHSERAAINTPIQVCGWNDEWYFDSKWFDWT